MPLVFPNLLWESPTHWGCIALSPVRSQATFDLSQTSDTSLSPGFLMWKPEQQQNSPTKVASRIGSPALSCINNTVNYDLVLVVFLSFPPRPQPVPFGEGYLPLGMRFQVLPESKRVKGNRRAAWMYWHDISKPCSLRSKHKAQPVLCGRKIWGLPGLGYPQRNGSLESHREERELDWWGTPKGDFNSKWGRICYEEGKS